MLEREKKKVKLVEKYSAKRALLKKAIKSETDFDEMMKLQLQLAKMPVNSSPVRCSTRCNQCGRSHAVFKKFALCRICLRQQLMFGNVTGGRKASW